MAAAGDMAVDEMAELIGFVLPPKRRYETVAGLVVDAFKHLPSLGQAVKLGNWRFEVVDLDGRRVDKILASRVAEVHRQASRAPNAEPTVTAAIHNDSKCLGFWLIG